MLANYGVHVRIVEFLDALPIEDADVSKEITKAYKKLGVAIHTGAAVQTVDDDGSKVSVQIKDNKTGNVDTTSSIRCYLPSVSHRGSQATALKTRALNFKNGPKRSRSMRACAPTFRTSTPSAMSLESCSSRT